RLVALPERQRRGRRSRAPVGYELRGALCLGLATSAEHRRPDRLRRDHSAGCHSAHPGVHGALRTRPRGAAVTDLPPLHHLLPHHVEDCLRSGLSTDTIIAAGLYSASAVMVKDLVGSSSGSGMVIPYAANGDGLLYVRVRLDR